MDVSTIGGLGTAAYVTKDLLVKLLGPTTDYIGDGLKNQTKKACDNISRVFRTAISRAGNMSDGKAVPPRVLKRVLEEAAFCENELMSDYLGGVLASSRTSSSRDDRAATWVNTLSRLSSYEIRAHYLIYWSLRQELAKLQDCERTIRQIRTEQFALTISRSEFLIAMELEGSENESDILDEINRGLKREELVAYIAESAKNLVITPAPSGMALLLWVNGFGQHGIERFVSAPLTPLCSIPVLSGNLKRIRNNADPTWL